MDSTPPIEEGEEEWELRHDADGFIYKILKRRRLTPTSPPQEESQVDEEKHRRERKKKILLKLRSRYRQEIQHWELLSNTLRALQETTAQQSIQPQNPQLETAVTPVEDGGGGEARGSLMDELLSQAEAQEAVISSVSSLCDVAEAMCNDEEERLFQSFIDLPIWSSSPRELMASLSHD